MLDTLNAVAHVVVLHVAVEVWERALEEGLPYQTLISSLLHKYASGRLREI
jgi:predicted DNA binding CopG/RHH family protein